MRIPDVHVAPEVSEMAPELRIYMLHAKGLAAAICRMKNKSSMKPVTKRVLQRNLTLEDLPQTSPFAEWRALFGKMKLQPSSFRSSVEALTRRIIRDGALPLTGITIVDAYNGVSADWSVPMGAYDLSRVGDKIDIRLARATDKFQPLGGKSKDFPLKNTVIVYAMADQVLCYGLNCRDSSLTSVDDQTDEAVFFAESLDKRHVRDAIAALSSLGQTLQAAGALTSLPVEVTSARALAKDGPVMDDWDETLCGLAS